MGLSWCKVASNLDSHPKIRKAGRAGREVFLFALRRNAEPGNPVFGMLPAAQLEPWYVADQLQMSEAEAVTGVTAAVEADLLAIDGLSYVIVGWESEWSKEREDYLSRKRENQSNWRKRRDERMVTTVTSGHARLRNQRVDQNNPRREEKRREEKESGKPDPVATFAEAAVTEINRLAKKRYDPAGKSIRRDSTTLVKAKHTPEAALRVIRSKVSWLNDSNMAVNFRPSTLLRPNNFERYLDDLSGVPERRPTIASEDDPPQLKPEFRLEAVSP